MALYAFDGTWNEDEADEAKDTNVVKFGDAYTERKFYLKGVGTRLGFIGKILGGVTGAGGKNLNIGWTLTLPDNVKKCCHAMALDERRGNFPLTRVRAPAGGLSTVERLQEVWFRGVHSDVGGGASVGLSSIALCWMLRRAGEAGLPIAEAKISKNEALCNPEASISKNFDPKSDPPRRILQGDAVHESVRPRGKVGSKEHNDPLPGMAIARG